MRHWQLSSIIVLISVLSMLLYGCSTPTRTLPDFCGGERMDGGAGGRGADSEDGYGTDGGDGGDSECGYGGAGGDAGCGPLGNGKPGKGGKGFLGNGPEGKVNCPTP